MRPWASRLLDGGHGWALATLARLLLPVYLVIGAARGVGEGWREWRAERWAIEWARGRGRGKERT